MKRSPNAKIAVDQFERLLTAHGWSAVDAWKGIAHLLLHCDIWTKGWTPFHGCVVYRESNDFKVGPKGPGAVLARAEQLSAYLAQELGVPRADLCGAIGQYWRLSQIREMQPHNLVGHAFRSMVTHALQKFGDNGITYDEEVSPYTEFPGLTFSTRSKDPKIDIVARRGKNTVALISSRWRFRHDRVDVVEEAMAYAPAALRHNTNCKLYAMVGEFAPNRLEKILSNVSPATPHGALHACIHFAPDLISKGLGENGRLKHLKGLDWLIAETYRWR